MAESVSQFSSYLSRRAAGRSGLVAWVADRALGLVGTVLRWDDLARQRRALARLDTRLLRDIGRSRRDADREAGRWQPPWRPPFYRREG